MAEIDQHPQPVHLAHHIAAKIGQSAMDRGIGRCIRPGQVLEVGYRHIPRAKRIHLAQHRQRAADRMATFHSDQRGNPAVSLGRCDLGRTGGKAESIRIARDQPFHHVNLFQGCLHRLRFGQISADIDRPELRSDLAFAQAQQIGVHRHDVFGGIGGVGRIAEIEIRDHIFTPLAQLFGHIIMPVPHRRSLERSRGHRFR